MSSDFCFFKPIPLQGVLAGRALDVSCDGLDVFSRSSVSPGTRSVVTIFVSVVLEVSSGILV